MEKTTNPYKDLYIYYLQGRLSPNFIFSEEFFIGNWEEGDYSFLFFSNPADEQVELLLNSYSDLKLLDKFQMSYDQWHGEKLSSFCAGNIIIKPHWEIFPENACLHKTKNSILLDPGVVFGTGTHFTTRDCLLAIQSAFDEKVPEFALDIGTGTGILAIAASKLGCPLTMAVDINPLSAKTAYKNVKINQLDKKILVVCGSAENFMDYPSDFMIANIHYDLAEKLINSIGFYQKKRFVLSGLLKSQAKTIKDQLIKSNVEILRTWDQNGIWWTFLGRINQDS